MGSPCSKARARARVCLRLPTQPHGQARLPLDLLHSPWLHHHRLQPLSLLPLQLSQTLRSSWLRLRLSSRSRFLERSSTQSLKSIQLCLLSKQVRSPVCCSTWMSPSYSTYTRHLMPSTKRSLRQSMYLLITAWLSLSILPLASKLLRQNQHRSNLLLLITTEKKTKEKKKRTTTLTTNT